MNPISRVFVLSALVAGLVGCDKHITDKDIEFTSLAEVKRLSDLVTSRDPRAALIIDPRPYAAFEASRIPGAVSIDLPGVDPNDEPDPAMEGFGQIIVYGDNPGSAPARAMTKRLLAVGYDDVYLFPGGLEEWNGAKFQTESGPPAREFRLRRRRQ